MTVHGKALEYLAAGSHEVWQLDHESGEIFVQTNAGIRLLRGGAALEPPSRLIRYRVRLVGRFLND